MLAITAGAVISLFTLGSLAQAQSDSSGVIQSQASTVGTLAETVDELRAQLTDNGLKPVAPASSELVPDVVKGVDGARGFDGVDGPSGKDGKDGLDGRDGSNGLNGVDSTAVGTAGADGSDGGDGAPGINGANGTNGTNGANGVDGQPPTSWTYSDVSGFTYSCNRAPDFDPAAPRYQCAAAPSPTPTATPNP